MKAGSPSKQKKLVVPFIDDREYERFTLKNGLKCLLINDSNASLSSVCILNPRGSFYDPFEYQGMTHFLEHMLFLGSKKYPKEKFYREFISLNGGKSNAWTFWNFTYYHFDVMHRKFEQALDILANQLSEPLLDEDTAKREIWAVNSEHFVNSASNVARYHSLLRDLSHPMSAFSKYLLGNVKTLQAISSKFGENELEKLNKIMDFEEDMSGRDAAFDSEKMIKLVQAMRYHFKSVFSADKMYAVLLSSAKIPDLKQIAERTLGILPVRSKIETINFRQDPGPINEYGTLTRFKPLNQWEFISLMFFFPPLVKKLSKPLKFLNYLIGSSSNLSMTSFLKDQGLVFDTYCFFEHGVNFFSYAEYRITLTKKGHEQFEKVLKGFAAYLFWLKTKAALKDEDFLGVYRGWLQEKRIVAYYSCGAEQGLDYCSQLAKNMELFGYDDPELLLSHKAPVFEDSPSDFTDIESIDWEKGFEDVVQLLKLMDGNKVVGFYCSSNFEYEGPSPKTRFGKIYNQPIHGVKYTIEDRKEFFKLLFAFDWDDLYDENAFQEALREQERKKSNPNSNPGSKPGSKPTSQRSIPIVSNTLTKSTAKGGIAFDIHMSEAEAFGTTSNIDSSRKQNWTGKRDDCGFITDSRQERFYE